MFLSILKNINNMIKTTFKYALNFILPYSCVNCNLQIDSFGLCPICFGKLKVISTPKCSTCSEPFMGRSSHTQCLSCQLNPKPYNTFCAVLYDDDTKGIILGFKHADKLVNGEFMANQMLRAIRDLHKVDYVIPVPLHYFRLLKRLYNQSSLLGQIIAKNKKIPILHRTLLRIKPTASQGNKKYSQRRKNIKNAFSLNNASKIKGKNILLVDDVYTSGATLDECAKTLLGAGARKVYAVVYAKTQNSKILI